jgi:hypothetical protein
VLFREIRSADFPKQLISFPLIYNDLRCMGLLAGLIVMVFYFATTLITFLIFLKDNLAIVSEAF